MKGLKPEEHTPKKELGINKETYAIIVSKYLGSMNCH